MYKHFQDSYLLTETESKQCNVWSMGGKVPKDPYGHISIAFDDNIHKEVEVSVHDLCACVCVLFVCLCMSSACIILCIRACACMHFSYSIIPNHYYLCVSLQQLRVFRCYLS